MGSYSFAQSMSGTRLAVLTAAVVAIFTMRAARADQECQKHIKLAKASGGVFMDASGAADVTAHGGRETLKVSVRVPVPNSVPFLVYANGQLAGTVVVTAGGGQLELSSEGKLPLPSGLTPVCKVGSIKVTTSGGGLVLQGRF